MLYIRKADRKRLADQAMHLLVPEQTEAESVSLSASKSASETIKDKKT
ncbi:50S ribosomal protein L20 (fragment) [Magnetospirillum molischianum DSM 120]|uniref:50S ribosomal protein L20 n=1 Tax=Magnetospirillum molischianum DSM 120 TaxID=1150626 RepID=H8FQ14_MAGML